MLRPSALMVSLSNHEGGHPSAFIGARIFDGLAFHDDSALIVDSGRIAAIVPVPSIPPDARRQILDGGILAPGLVDLQVNGGGGVQFNETPTCEAIATICAAHGRAGTTSLLVTLISSDAATRERAIAAGAEAWARRVPGFAGLHLEGPHLTRAGAHDPRSLRPMIDADAEALLAARRRLPALLVTVAPESCALRHIARLVAGGITVSLGHSSATAAEALQAVEAGATLVTHLFNAMQPLSARAPGLAGTALDCERLTPSLIGDGAHVAPELARLALRATAGRLLLVSDAMAPAGSDTMTATLDGVPLRRDGLAMRRPDGALAGSASVLLDGIRWLSGPVGAAPGPALAAATSRPAAALGIAPGTLLPGAAADLVHLRDDLTLARVWRADAAQL